MCCFYGVIHQQSRNPRACAEQMVRGLTGWLWSHGSLVVAPHGMWQLHIHWRHHISSGAQWKPVVQQQQPRRESLPSTAIFCPVTCSTPWLLRHSAPWRTRHTNSSPRSAGEHHCVQPICVKRLSCISASQQQSNVLTRSACPTHSFPSPHSGHPDNSHTLLNVSHLGNEVPGSKKNNNNNPICKAPECQKTSVALADRNSRAN